MTKGRFSRTITGLTVGMLVACGANAQDDTEVLGVAIERGADGAITVRNPAEPDEVSTTTRPVATAAATTRPATTDRPSAPDLGPEPQPEPEPEPASKPEPESELPRAEPGPHGDGSAVLTLIGGAWQVTVETSSTPAITPNSPPRLQQDLTVTTTKERATASCRALALSATGGDGRVVGTITITILQDDVVAATGSQAVDVVVPEGQQVALFEVALPGPIPVADRADGDETAVSCGVDLAS